MPKLQFMKLSILSFALVLFFGNSFGAAFAQSKIKDDGNIGYSFACYRDPETNKPTTFLASNDGRIGIPIIRWEYTGFVGYSPVARCNIVSKRMQALRVDSALITNSQLNGEPVLCAAYDKSSRESRCTNSRLILTLQSNDAADKVLSDIEAVVKGNGSGVVTRDVPPTAGGKFYVDMSKLVKVGKFVRLGERLTSD